MIYYTLDSENKVHPVSFKEWCKWFATANRKIAQTQIGSVEVSTVFLGIDHSFFGQLEPVLFETMVFGGLCDGEQHRYRTRTEALKGHLEMLQLVIESILNEEGNE